MKHSTPEYFPVMAWEEHKDGLVIFDVQSDTSPLTTYHPAVDFQRGTVDCDCRDFEHNIAPRHRLANTNPRLNSPKDQCKHLWSAVNAFMREYLKAELNHG